ncbi:Rdx family protein [Desulfobacterota bacterium M19]
MPQASSLRDQLSAAIEADIKLVPGSGGIFTVQADGVEIFSKKKAGHKPEAAEIIALLQQKA